MTEFSQAVIEKIGYYVYFLKNPDPNNNIIFYVGKGTGNRIFHHIKCAIENEKKSDKLELIRKIGADNVEHYILRHGLTEKEALDIESACIDLLGFRNENLTNENKGLYSFSKGLRTVDEIVQYYDAKTVIITEPMVIITINRLYKRFISPEDLYRVTRKRWKIGKKREKAKYAIASYRGLIREIYEIHKWHKCKNGRWGFKGNVANDEIRNKYINQSLDNYIKQGNRNPIKYTFK